MNLRPNLLKDKACLEGYEFFDSHIRKRESFRPINRGANSILSLKSIKLGIFCVLLSCQPIAVAQAIVVEPGHLWVVYGGKFASEDKRDEFLSLCNNVGSSLLAGKGIWGEGVFKSFHCFSGAKASKAGKPDWILQVSENDDRTELTLFFVVMSSGKVKRVLEAKMTLPYSLSRLGETDDARLAAFAFLNSLPFSRYIGNKRTSGFSFSEKGGGPVPPPPKSYDIFTLRYLSGQGIWVPQLIGKAKLDEKDSGNGDALKKWKVKYSRDDNQNRGTAIWAKKSGSERGVDQATVKKLIEKKTEVFIGQAVLLDSLSSGYAGFRYGYPLIKGDPLLEKSHMVGIFTEVRAGPLNGLRWYWDFAPEVTTIENGKKLSFTWSRATFGWSFGLDFDGIISKVDAVPKLGLMDLDAKIGIPSAIAPQITYVVQFRQKNVLNLGIEFGAESQLSWLLLRMWAARDISGFIDLGGDTSVSSMRGGIDIYHDLMVVWDYYKVTILGFTAMDQITFKKKNISGEETIGDTGIKLSGLKYDLFYAGFGVSVSW